MIHAKHKTDGRVSEFPEVSWNLMSKKDKEEWEITTPEPPAEVVEGLKANKPKPENAKPKTPKAKKEKDANPVDAAEAAPDATTETADDQATEPKV